MSAGLSHSGLSTVFGVSAVFAGKPFDIYAVDEQAKDVLKTANLLSGQLEEAILLRDQKASRLLNSEKQRIDRTLSDVQAAIAAVISLAERVKGDSEALDGKIRLRTRVLFVLRDSPRIRTALVQLTIAAASLDRELTILCARSTCCVELQTMSLHQLGVRKGAISGPPTYTEATFLSERRARNTRRRSNALSELDSSDARSISAPRASIELAADEGFGPAHDKSKLNTCSRVSIISDSELFLEDWAQASMPAYEMRPEEAPQRATNGRQRSLRWLETRASDQFVMRT